MARMTLLADGSCVEKVPSKGRIQQDALWSKLTLEDVPPWPAYVCYRGRSGRRFETPECPLMTDTVEKGLVIFGEQ